jgi:type IV pilus assembly protein PilN
MIHINLLPVRASKKKEAGKQQLILFALVLLIGVGGNYWWNAVIEGGLHTKEQKLKRTKDEIAQLEKIIGEVNNITAEKKALQDKLAVLDKLKAGKTGPVKLLDELAKISPKKLWLSKMEEKGGAMAFDGTASSNDEVAEFMAALKKSPYFTGVELKATKLNSSTQFQLYDFTVNCTANYTPGEGAQATNAPKP